MVIACIVVTATVFYSCAKNTSAKEHFTEEQAVSALASSDGFVSFSKRFVTDFAALMQYHRSQQLLVNKDAFLLQVRSAGTDMGKLPAIYQGASLDFDQALILKNNIDNDILSLLNQNKFLVHFNEAQQQRIILNALDEGFHSSDEKWLAARNEISFSLKNISLLQSGAQRAKKTVNGPAAGMDLKAEATPPAGLSIDEVWDCLKKAVGIGAAGVLTIGALTKLAETGIQAVVVAVSKWIAARAGWFGVALMAIEFGSCIYTEARD